MYTDPIADMLTRIRNAGAVRHASVEMPASKLKLEIARVLKAEGYIADYSRVEGIGYGTLVIELKYYRNKHVITGIQRASRPGQRAYYKAADLPQVLNGFGIAIVSTSQGVQTGRAAKAAGVGGELICRVW